MGSWLASHALNASMVSMRSRDGWRCKIELQRVQMPARGHRQVPGLAVHMLRTLPAGAAALQRRQHALAHFLRRAAREGERQNALRRIDQGQQPQIALHQQASFCPEPAGACTSTEPGASMARSRAAWSDRRSVMELRLHPRAPPGHGTVPATGSSCRHASVGATAARPAAKSAARVSMRPDHTSIKAARLSMPSSVVFAAPRLEDLRADPSRPRNRTRQHSRGRRRPRPVLADAATHRWATADCRAARRANRRSRLPVL